MSRKLFVMAVLGTMLIAVTTVGVCQAQESAETIEAPVVEAKLFKNGLAMITRTLSVEPEGGTFLIREAPNPVHGTFWVEGDADVTIRFVEKEVAKKPETLSREILIEQLLGKEVDVFLDDKEQISGTVISITEKSPRSFDVNYVRDRYPYYSSYYRDRRSYTDTKPAAVNYLVISTDEGTDFIDFSKIWRLRLRGTDKEMKTVVRQPSMELSVKPAKKKQEVRISYLTKGLAWAPSYRLVLSEKDKGSITMKAVIKNELMDIFQAHFSLISGFPAIRFEHVTSPISLDTTWSRFFSDLCADPSSYRGGAMAMAQAVVFNVAVAATLGPIPEFLSEGYDLHFQDVGKRTVGKGEAVLIPIATAPIKFKRIVEWIIPDVRNERGRYRRADEINRNPEMFQDAVWDAVQFPNPYRFPMTTGPVSVYKDGKFYGQTLSFWTAPDEETVVHVTKALNIRAKHSEHELEGKRVKLYIMGDDYQKCVVEGKLVIRNYRNKSEHLVIRRRFSGKLLTAEGNPTRELLPEGVYSVNERYELRWEIELEPGKEVVLTYQYEVLVDI